MLGLTNVSGVNRKIVPYLLRKISTSSTPVDLQEAYFVSQEDGVSWVKNHDFISGIESSKLDLETYIQNPGYTYQNGYNDPRTVYRYVDHIGLYTKYTFKNMSYFDGSVWGATHTKLMVGTGFDGDIETQAGFTNIAYVDMIPRSDIQYDGMPTSGAGYVKFSKYSINSKVRAGYYAWYFNEYGGYGKVFYRVFVIDDDLNIVFHSNTIEDISNDTYGRDFLNYIGGTGVWSFYAKVEPIMFKDGFPGLVYSDGRIKKFTNGVVSNVLSTVIFDTTKKYSDDGKTISIDSRVF